MIKEWSKLSWQCGCGALNAGWLDKCGKCKKEKNEKSFKSSRNSQRRF